MNEVKVVAIHSALTVGTETAIDRMGLIASKAVEQHKPNYAKQIQLVRQYATSLCASYRNCRAHDWCFTCSSGQNGRPLFRGDACLGCKLLAIDSPDMARRSKLVQIALNGLSDIT